MSNFDPTKKGKEFIDKDSYIDKNTQIEKKRDGRNGVDINVEKEVSQYNRAKHENAIRDKMAEAFKGLNDKADKTVNTTVDKNATYKGIPIDELPPYLKLVYAMELQAQADKDAINDPSDM
jgi:hypothetical protein